MIKMKDIAVKGGVSVMTVSKVLRDAPDISARTKVRIRALAEQMGYIPDAMAQGLRTHTTRLLGLVIPSVANPLYARMIMAIEERAQALGYELILSHSHNNVEREEQMIRRLMARRVDGLFISPVYRMSPTSSVYQELEARAIPTVLLGHSAPFCSQFVGVETDNTAASYTATCHLLELGHRQIAFLGGPAVSPSAQECFEGYRRALRENKMTVDDQLIFAAGTTIEDGEKGCLQLLDEGMKATAVQAVSDLVAIGAASVLLRQGFSIPRDVSVVGFGNILLSEYFRVPLTTLRQPKFHLGIAAMELMQKMLDHESVATRRLEAELIVRESSGVISQPPPMDRRIQTA